MITPGTFYNKKVISSTICTSLCFNVSANSCRRSRSAQKMQYLMILGVPRYFNSETIVVPGSGTKTYSVRNKLIAIGADFAKFNGEKIIIVGLSEMKEISDTDGAWSSQVTFSFASGVLTMTNKTGTDTSLRFCLIG